jgi:hypothetical protein
MSEKEPKLWQPPKHVGEAIAQAHKERGEPASYTENVLGQIADALIKIEWAVVGIHSHMITKR